MGQINRFTSGENSPLKVKRVIKKGSDYLCGICHRSFEQRDHAITCLKNCAQLHLKQNMLEKILKKTGESDYRCKYCQRVYQDLAPAKTCVSICGRKASESVARTKLTPKGAIDNEKLKLLQDLSGGSLVPTKAASARPSTCKFCGKKYSDARSAVLCERQHKQEAALSAGGKSNASSPNSNQARLLKQENQSTLSGAAKPKSQPSKNTDGLTDQQRKYLEMAMLLQSKKDKNVYLRSGAQYVCKVCKSTFYTKVEVLECFNIHLNPQRSHAEMSEDKGPLRQELAVTSSTPDLDQEQTPAIPSQSKKPEDIEKKIDSGALFRVDHSDNRSFLRDGAKYICRKCRKNYFSRSEVTECFASHSEDDEEN